MKTSTLLATLLTGPRNLLANSVWACGGATPTRWTGALTGTSAVYGVAPDGISTSYRQTATAQRPYLAPVSGVTVAASGSWTASFYIESVLAGTFTVGDILAWANGPSGSTQTYLKNDVAVASSSAVASGDRIGCVLTTSGTAGLSIPRFGVGVNSNFTGDLVMSRPQVVASPAMRRYRPTV